jgi:hypothetical protein
MAFLVCYSVPLATEHGPDKAIYLDQAFYELIFKHCRAADGRYHVLGEIASLRYKSPTLVLSNERLNALNRDLAVLEQSGHLHPQIAAFREACSRANRDGCALTVSGDMYPEL